VLLFSTDTSSDESWPSTDASLRRQDRSKEQTPKPGNPVVGPEALSTIAFYDVVT